MDSPGINQSWRPKLKEKEPVLKREGGGSNSTIPGVREVPRDKRGTRNWQGEKK